MSASKSRVWRRLAIAAGISGAVHAGVVLFGQIEPPPPPEEPLPLAVRIENIPAPAHVAPLPRIKAPQEKRVKRPQAPRIAAIAGPSSFAVPVTPEPERVAEAAPEPEAVADAAPPEPVVVATAPQSAVVIPEPPAPPPVRTLSKKGRITYDLVYGRDRFPVGRTVQTWQMNGARYQLASRSETTGIVDLVRSQHRTYFSSGELTQDGLKPEKFLMSRNRGRGTEEARAQFDWPGASVTLGSAATQRQESLPPRSQDLLSFMYQLALDPPPPGRLVQTVTNGRNIERYVLDVLPEEKIETPIGILRALPIKQIPKAGEESLQLWLATEYRYLPVRIRFFDRAGEPQGEQVVTEIRLSDN